jgi:hypothetical protein
VITRVLVVAVTRYGSQSVRPSSGVGHLVDYLRDALCHITLPRLIIDRESEHALLE